nr:putative capsid protein [Crucivirus sp.]
MYAKKTTKRKTAPQYARKTYSPRVPAQKVEIIEVVPKPKRVYKPRQTMEVVQKSSGFNAVPNSFGAKLGGWLGHGIGSVVKAITGFGDYTVRENSLMNLNMGGIDPPSIVNSRNGVIIRHREFIGNVLGATVFTLQSFKIQPGLVSSFPWLSQVADAYQEWRPRGIIYEFKSLSSDAVIATNSSGSLGSVIMATQYDSTLANFPDKRTMENSEYANSCKPSCSMLHPIECMKSQSVLSNLYLRAAGISLTGKDPRFYDLGNFQIAVEGMASGSAGQTIGELWVTFEVEMYKPELGLTGAGVLTDHFSTGVGTNTITSTNPFGNLDVFAPATGNTIGCVIRQAAGNFDTIQFPSNIQSGIYLIAYFMNGTTPTVANSASIANGSSTNISTTGKSALFLNGTTNIVFAPNNGATVSSFSYQQIVEVVQTTPGSKAAIQVALSGVLPSGTQNGNLFITLLNPFIN